MSMGEEFKPVENEQGMRGKLQDAYSESYGAGEGHDSAAGSRLEIAAAIMDALRNGHVNPRRVLDIGSGPQLLERELMHQYWREESRRLLSDTLFVTTDIADIPKKHLRASSFVNAVHAQVDAASLPFKDGTFGMVVSNVAIDVAPRKAFSEAAAALAPGGIFAFTLNHPETMAKLLELKTDDRIKAAIQFGLDNGMFYSSADDIRKALAEYGFMAKEVKEHHGTVRDPNKWWFVSGVKSARADE